MGKVKAKTHLETLGFSESDKKKPKHDIIQTWVYKNISQVLKETVLKDSTQPFEIGYTKWEHEVVYTNGNYKSIIGYVDIYTSASGFFNLPYIPKKEKASIDIYIEVKTEIPSLGELIRQLRAYQSYNNHNGYYVVVCPDDTHKEILKEQGFFFYKYQDPTQLF